MHSGEAARVSVYRPQESGDQSAGFGHGAPFVHTLRRVWTGIHNRGDLMRWVMQNGWGEGGMRMLDVNHATIPFTNTSTYSFIFSTIRSPISRAFNTLGRASRHLNTSSFSGSWPVKM